MKSRLLDLLVCPDCQAALHLEEKRCEDQEIVSGLLRCPACAASFPIREGIPRFVSSDAYASTFSFEWQRWRRTQFDSEARKKSESSFLASTGKPPAELAGKLVLDAGCGAGRFLDLMARAGAEAVGVDISLAIEVARENLQSQPKCHFVQADLFRLPFRPGTFEFIYSIGVLHHTPDPAQAFLRLRQTLKPGGEIAIWVYPKRRLAETFHYFPDRVNEVLAEDVNYRIPPRWAGLVRRWAGVLDGITETSSALERAVTTRLPLPWLHRLCYAAIPLYYLFRLPPFYPLRLIIKIAMDPDPQWRVLDTFDWYSPRYQWKQTVAQVRSWFETAGLGDVTILPRMVALRGKELVTTKTP